MNLNRNNIEQLVGKLKTEDARYARISRSFQIIYWILIPVYLLLTIESLTETKDINQLIGDVCFIISSLIFALFFDKYYKEYKYVDYALPTIQMLKNAANRYKPFHIKNIWVLIAVLFMDAGLCLNSSLNFSVVKVQIYFIGALILACIIGLIVWRIKYKGIRDNALSVIAEIERE
ncbi:hypothetical protein [Ancylomarina longa]|uniref:Uncharacterized protein n=1 Tax=Ancylomarina longa TaxID=2487017 RepID=A0A434AFI5_9BACT|nr:hypothetical protein [Ancylomarina longa]RUT73143.1 hypothetical protein DLK05_14770 [Ancylomarina longa]